MRHQGTWSIICLLVAVVVFFLVSVSTGPGSTAGNANAAIDSIPAEVWTALEEKRASAVTLLQQVRDGVPLYMLIPLIAVVGTAVMGVDTVICLSLGIFPALVFVMMADTLTLSSFVDLVYAGFSDAGS